MNLLNFLITNHQIIVNITAVVAFFISVAQLICTILKERTRISVLIENADTAISVHDDTFGKSCEWDNYVFLFTLNNKSSSPVSITKILILSIDGNEYPCNLTPHSVGCHIFHPNTDTPITNPLLTPKFPINLSGSQTAIEFVKFVIPCGTEIMRDRTIKLKLITNKKTVITSIQCPNFRSLFFV